jgi:hypothetical protein
MDFTSVELDLEAGSLELTPRAEALQQERDKSIGTAQGPPLDSAGQRWAAHDVGQVQSLDMTPHKGKCCECID